MPIYENWCPACSVRREFFSHRVTEENPPCESCGGTTGRIISSFQIIWTGPLTAKYNDPKLEGAEREGHWAWRRRSSLSGNPEPVYIDSFQKQTEFCKEEGLINPKDLPRNLEVSADGKSASSRGLPGQWV